MMGRRSAREISRGLGGDDKKKNIRDDRSDRPQHRRSFLPDVAIIK